MVSAVVQIVCARLAELFRCVCEVSGVVQIVCARLAELFRSCVRG